MKLHSYILAVFIFLLVLFGVGFAFYSSPRLQNGGAQQVSVSSFIECMNAGNPIMESYPRQCRSADGKTFTEEVSEQPTLEETPEIGSPAEETMVRVSMPLPNTKVTSPLTIKGSARGNWYFEASFPVELVDANGNQLTITPAQAQGDWMTTDFVPFSATLNWATSTTELGTLILHKDNPSGLPEHDAAVRIPVKF